MIELRDVTVQRTGSPRPGLHQVNLSVDSGESVLLLGPSGSGKSTLALTIAGLMGRSIPADVSGTISVKGSVATVFQDPDAQVVGATILDDACFGPENLGLPADEILERAHEALNAVGLPDRHDLDPSRLSGGQRQRLAIAGALAMRAPVLILDEPTANLDPAGVTEVYEVLTRLRREHGHTQILIEHRIDEALDIVDRILVLDHSGQLVIDGTVEEVFRGQNATRIAELGVWLPTAVQVTRRLRAAGVTGLAEVLRPSELSAALDAVDDLPTPLTRRRPEILDAPLVSARGLSVNRGDHLVLDGVNLDVGPGELLAILGGNGAGKTTLLHTLAGLITPRAGSVSVDGLNPATARARKLRRHLGVVFQNPEHQLVTSRVADELAHAPRIAGLDRGDIEQRVEAMLSDTDLRTYRDTHPFRLSGGQKRRLSVAAELVTGARVLLLDEPTYGQDQERAHALMRRLDELRADGAAIIVVTHDLQLVHDHATRAAVLQDGKLIADGAPSEVLSQPELLHAAGLRPPLLASVTTSLRHHPDWHDVTSFTQLPGDAS